VVLRGPAGEDCGDPLMFWRKWSAREDLPEERPMFVVEERIAPPEERPKPPFDMDTWRGHFRDAADEALAAISPDSHEDTMRRAARFCARWADVAMEMEGERKNRDE